MVAYQSWFCEVKIYIYSEQSGSVPETSSDHVAMKLSHGYIELDSSTSQPADSWNPTLKQELNGRYFAHDIFKLIFMKENASIKMQIS